VSPFRPSFSPQPVVYSRNRLLLPSSAPRNVKISPLRAIFLATRLPRAPFAKGHSTLTTSHCRTPRFPRFHRLTNPSLPTIDLQPSRYQQLTNPSFRNPFVFSSIQNPRGCRGADFQFSISVALRRRLPRPARGGKSHVFRDLQPLCPLFAPLSAPLPFIFNRLQPLLPKHPGGGVS
jgi:hypothetical protein